MNPAPNVPKHLKMPRVSALLIVSLSVHSLSCVKSSGAVLPRELTHLLIVLESQLVPRLSLTSALGGFVSLLQLSSAGWLLEQGARGHPSNHPLHLPAQGELLFLTGKLHLPASFRRWVRHTLALQLRGIAQFLFRDASIS